MRQPLTPMLFDDHDRATAEKQRRSPISKVTVSPAVRRKAARKRTDVGHPVLSFRRLLADLATVTRNTVRFGAKITATILATPLPPNSTPLTC
jgi:hypothetical protein